MSASIIEDLYFDSKFDSYVSKLASRRGILFEDLKQEAFAEMVFAEAETIKQCKAALMRVADRLRGHGGRNDYTYDDDLGDESLGERRDTKNWYWRGVSPEMNKDVDPELAWTD